MLRGLVYLAVASSPKAERVLSRYSDEFRPQVRDKRSDARSDTDTQIIVNRAQAGPHGGTLRSSRDQRQQTRRVQCPEEFDSPSRRHILNHKKMRVFTTKFRGSEVNVIFNGSHYYFLNSYYGILAIAERDYNKTTCSNGECKTSFAVTTGNHHTVGGSLGGSVVAALVKKFIRKAEQVYCSVEVDFAEDITADLANGCLTTTYIQR